MYNLNINVATTAANVINNLLAVENSCATPRTPEILNSLIAMTNPLDSYSFSDDTPKIVVGPLTSMSSDSNSSSCSQVESPTSTPPSIQHTCSQLIKAGLKLSIEQKRKLQSEGEDIFDLDKCKRIKKTEYSESEEDRHNCSGGLTPEDEERRRRRRERNKIAATKCRLKKREKTANLVSESETLETQNVELKTQIQELQNQRHQLLEMLTLHRPNCQRNIQPVTRDALFENRPAMVSSITENNNHSYNHNSIQSVSNNNRPVTTVDTLYGRSSINLVKAESLVLSTSNVYEKPHTTNLDNLDDRINASYYNSQCHNYSSTQNYSNSGCMV